MILPDKLIKEQIELGSLKIIPLPDKIEGSSVDLTLSNKFKKLIAPMVDIHDKKTFQYEEIESDEIIFSPGEFMLGATNETIELSPKISAFVQGRSSIGRLGLAIEIAGFVDAGFKGTITLEMLNVSNKPIKIYAGSKICQIIFVEMKEEPEVPYNIKKSQKYMNQIKPEGSKIYEES